MTTMRDSVERRVEKFEAYHRDLKTKRFGWLVRPTILLVGTVVIIFGLITIPLPGPGWLTVFVGIAILSLEARWAKSLLTWGVGVYDSFFEWYHRQPRAVRGLLIALLIAIILATFFVVAWVTWGAGGADFLTPMFSDQLGMTRF